MPYIYIYNIYIAYNIYIYSLLGLIHTVPYMGRKGMSVCLGKTGNVASVNSLGFVL